MIEDLIQAYSTNTRLLLISAVTFAFGYAQYLYSFRLVLKEHKAPFPLWMHTLYLAHDATACVVFYLLAREHGWFWFFTLTSIALAIWTLFELFCLYMAIKVEREEIWGRYQQGPVTVVQALSRVIAQTLFMLALVNLLRVLMADETMFKWFALTNVVMAVGPGLLWRQRQSRAGSSVGLAIVIVLGTLWTFLPPGFGMFTTALPYFDQPLFYLVGFAASLCALNNLRMLLRFPSKTPAAIW